MTRINLIDPSELYDQHLMAEYREIFMIPAALKRTLSSKRGFNRGELPALFTLGKGHVRFFYDKGKYLDKRYQLLTLELKLRGFKLDENRKFPSAIFIKNNLYLDWSPTQRDFNIIRQRLSQKIAMKPGWYRKTGKK